MSFLSRNRSDTSRFSKLSDCSQSSIDEIHSRTYWNDDRNLKFPSRRERHALEKETIRGRPSKGSMGGAYPNELKCLSKDLLEPISLRSSYPLSNTRISSKQCLHKNQRFLKHQDHQRPSVMHSSREPPTTPKKLNRLIEAHNSFLHKYPSLEPETQRSHHRHFCYPEIGVPAPRSRAGGPTSPSRDPCRRSPPSPCPGQRRNYQEESECRPPVETKSIDIIDTPEGRVEATKQLSLQRKVSRTHEGETIHRTISSKKLMPTGKVKDISIDVEQQHVGFTPVPDIISVTDIVNKGHGYTEYKRIVEHTKIDESGGPSPERLRQLVQEEADDVDRTQMLEPISLEDSFSAANYVTMKTIHGMRLKPSILRDLEQSIPPLQLSPDQELEEFEPEALAAILHAEEMGLNLEASPGQACNFLTGVTEERFVEVSPIAPGPLSELIVPAGPSDSFAPQLTTAEMQEALYIINDLPIVPPQLKDGEYPENDDNIYTREHGQSKFDQSKQHVQSVSLVFRPKHHASGIEDETAPWDNEDVAEMSRISGAAPSQLLSGAQNHENLDVSMLPAINELADSFEFITLSGPPKHYSRVQLRGGTRPNWFPGYYVSLPGLDTLVKATTNPNNVLPSAWRAVQPLLYEEDGSVVL